MNFSIRHGALLCTLVVASLAAALVVCGWSAGTEATVAPALLPAGAPGISSGANAFGDYWYQGKAELTRYRLQQARYGYEHEGDAVLVFVTEDFLTDRHVKLESPPAGRDVTKVLKLNLTKKFVTGIYQYSMMTSVFTPVDDPRATLKVTTSSQEWCGHTWTQLDRREDARFDVEQRSYFESEGDTTFVAEGPLLEDAVWTTIRIDPTRLPTGRIRMIPGTMTERLRHTPLQAIDAVATLENVSDATGAGTDRYTIDYGNGDRVLSIEFGHAFPHVILGWTETYVDGFGDSAHRMTTRATRTNSIMLDYWNHHAPKDRVLRDSLGLERNYER